MSNILDIRLDDMVISLHTKTMETVVQYNFSKILQAKGFIHTKEQLNKPPNIILNIIARLQTNYTQEYHKVLELLLIILEANLAIANF